MNSIDLTAWTSAAATFVGFVIADDQQQRVKNGGFGAIAGTSLGAVGAIATKNTDMLLWSAFGASAGAVVGWLVHLALCVIGAWPSGRRVLEYMSGGLKSVQSRLDRDDTELLLRALDGWTKSFSRQIDQQGTAVLQMEKSRAADDISCLLIRSWLTSVVDAFNVIFSRLAARHEYRLRTSLIVFGRQGDRMVGKHWLAYAGELADHRDKPFDEKSIAYRVLSGELPSPTYQKLGVANKDGQDRGINQYSSFYAFRINAESVLTIDWPDEVLEQDPFVVAARAFVHTELVPGIQRVLRRWSRPLSEELNLAASVDTASNSPRIHPVPGPEDGHPIGANAG